MGSKMIQTIYLINRTSNPDSNEILYNIKQELKDELSLWGYVIGFNRSDKHSDLLLLEEKDIELNECFSFEIVVADYSIITDNNVYISANDNWKEPYLIKAILILSSPKNFKYRSFKYWFSPMCYMQLVESSFASIGHYLNSILEFNKEEVLKID
ncbi:hypothetical protein PQ460_10665 [Paenibacillus sp. KACC 21273]|uniref:hypothetical protein n=1 Tax=Paenibacillus sp. KACC 21273 TaxID=3025665 RepID=UPI00236549B5|nr:hypothetical protein [Paenibacillus sp. KACC 21273]WDF52845.1 hypothetical protein PQ460_10665 [Paenibacillus sp. KACC 21273]